MKTQILSTNNLDIINHLHSFEDPYGIVGIDIRLLHFRWSGPQYDAKNRIRNNNRYERMAYFIRTGRRLPGENYSKLETLYADIKKRGVFDPLLVHRLPNGEFAVTVGNQRLSIYLGINYCGVVPCRINLPNDPWDDFCPARTMHPFITDHKNTIKIQQQRVRKQHSIKANQLAERQRHRNLADQRENPPVRSPVKVTSLKIPNARHRR